MFKRFLLYALLLLASLVLADECDIYRWIDEDGVVHYSERPSEGRECSKVDLPEPLTAGEIEQAVKIYEKLIDDQSVRRVQRTREEQEKIKKPSGAGRPLVPMPLNETSLYLETSSSGINWNVQKLCGQFSLDLRLHEKLPGRILLEAHFPNPASPGKVDVVKVRVNRRASKVHLESHRLRGFECQNYQVVVHIYDRKDLDHRIGSHYQFIQSNVNLSRVKNTKQLVSALVYGNCRDD